MLNKKDIKKRLENILWDIDNNRNTKGDKLMVDDLYRAIYNLKEDVCKN